MSLLIDNLKERFCPETAGDILLELNRAEYPIEWTARDLNIALIWANSKQGHAFWMKIRMEEEKAIYNKQRISVDIYSL